MDYWRREQIGASTGIAAAVLAVAASLVVRTFPDPSATDEAVRDFLATNRTDLLTQAWLFGLSLAAGIWFLGSLRGFLRRAEGGAGRVSAIAYGAGLLTIASFGLGLVCMIGASYPVTATTDPAIPAAIFQLGNAAVTLAAFPIMVLAASVTLVIATTRTLPLLLAGIGAVVAVVAVIASLSLFVDSGAMAVGGDFTFYGPFVAAQAWLLALSAMLIPRLARPTDVRLARRRIGDVEGRAPRVWEGQERRAAEGRRDG